MVKDEDMSDTAKEMQQLIILTYLERKEELLDQWKLEEDVVLPPAGWYELLPHFC